MSSIDSNLAPESDSKMLQRKNIYGAQKSADTKVSGPESSISNNTAGGKPERRRRKFSPLEKDISSRLFPGANMNSKNLKGSETDKNPLKNIKPSKSPLPKIIVPPSEEGKNNLSSTNDAPTSSSSLSSEKQERKVPQQDMQEPLQMTDKTISRETTIEKSDLDISNDLKRKFDSNEENTNLMREAKKFKKKEIFVIENKSSEDVNKSAEKSTAQYISGQRKGTTQTPKTISQQDCDGNWNQSDSNAKNGSEKDKSSLSSSIIQVSNPPLRGKELKSLTASIDPADECPKKQHLFALLQHRKMLLENVIKCKNTSKNQLDIMNQQQGKDSKLTLKMKEDSGSDKIAIPLDKKSRNMREQIKIDATTEIKEFRKMSDLVSQTIKRQRSFQGTFNTGGESVEKNRSSSLRRTSNKKQGSNEKNDSFNSSCQSSSQKTSNISPNSVTSGNVEPTYILNSSSSQQIFPNNNQNESVHKESFPSTFPQVPDTPVEKMKSLSAQNYATGNKNRKKCNISPPKTMQSISQTGPKTALLNKKSNVLVNQYKSNGISLSRSNTSGTAFTTPSTSSRHIHNIYDNSRDIKSNENSEYLKNVSNSKSTGVVLNGHLSTDPFFTTVPKAKDSNGLISTANIKKSFISPISEISVLCQKRKTILSKLLSRDLDRINKENGNGITKKIKPQTHLHSVPQNINRTNTLLMNNAKEKNSRTSKIQPNVTRLPPHRKTHWDYLLDEMRWLASDFMEERKWKISLASTLSNIITSNKNSIVEKFHDCKESISHAGSSCEQPTPSDIAHVKQIASAISFKVLEHWENMVDGGAAVDEGYGTYERIKLIKSCESNKTEKEDSDQVSDEYKDTSSSQSFDESQLIKRGICLMENDDKFEIMNARITEISKHAIEAKMRCEQMSADEIETTKTALSGCGLHLSNSQLRAVQYVENVWNMPLPGSLRKSIDGEAWKSTHYGCGAILNGGLGSGKTIVTGAILWKFRSEGPQLVICPHSSLIQWRHEIGRFSGLRLVMMGSHGGSRDNSFDCTSSNPIKLHAGDIVIGDFSCLQKEECIESEDQNFSLDGESSISTPLILHFQWSSVTIDLRHSNFSHAISQHTCRSKCPHPSYNQPLPPKLWRALHQNLQFVNNERKKKLVLRGGWEFTNSQKMARNLPVLEHNNDNSKIIAFLFPASIMSFYTPRRILLWAKKKHQLTKRNRKKRGTDLVGIQDVLDHSVENFQYTMSSICLKSSHVLSYENECTSNSSGFFQRNSLNSVGFWKVLKCQMDVEQKTSYRKCCFYVRGALSAYDSSRTNHGIIAAKAILRLRRTCLHANIWKTLNLSMRSSHHFKDETINKMRGYTGMNELMEKSKSYISNCSQPDIALANLLVRGSTKIAELLKILILDAKVQAMIKMEENEKKISLLPLNQTIDRSYRKEKQKSSCKTKQGYNDSYDHKKVLILASLPEAQLLLHRFLNSCGIPHAVLAAPSNKRESKRNLSASTAYVHGLDGTDREIQEEVSSIFKWDCSQTLLSHFDKHSHRNGNDVLISSPVSIAGTNGGISAGVADFVISFDEDWSGREMKLLEAIFRRSQSRKQNNECKTVFVRLLCADSCEESFFLGCQSDAKKLKDARTINSPELNSSQSKTPRENKDKLQNNQDQKNVIDVQTDVNGYVVSGYDEESKNNILVLGRQILDYRNQFLSTILHTDLAQDFATGKGHRFLPFNSTIIQGNNEKSDSNAEIAIGSHELAHLYPAFGRNRNIWYDDDFKLGDALALIEAEVCPLSNDLGFHFKLKQSLETKHMEQLDIQFAIASPQLTSFSKSFCSRMDLKKMPVRLYCERYGRDIMLREKFENKNVTESIGKEFDTDLAESWRKSGLGCPPGNQAMPLLCYKSKDEGLRSSYDGHKNMIEQAFIDNDSSSRKRKCNDNDDHLELDKSTSLSAYENFLSHWIRDGNDGQEHLLYSPPIFPGLLAWDKKQDDNPEESITPSPIASMNIQPISKNFGDDDDIDKAIMASSGDIMDDLISSTVTNILSGGDDGLDLISLGIPLNTQEKIDSTTNSSLLDVELQLSADLPDSSSAKAVTIDAGAADSIGSSESSIIPKFSNGEPFPVSCNSFYFARSEHAVSQNKINDYGLLGIGALKLKINSKEIAKKVPMETSSYKFWRDPFHFDQLSSELYNQESLATANSRILTEPHLILDYMLLYVKKFSKKNHTSSSSNLVGKNALSSLPFGFNKLTDEVPKRKDQTTNTITSKQRMGALKTRKHIIACLEKSKMEDIDKENSFSDEKIPFIVSLSDSAKVGDKAKETAISQRKAMKKNQTVPTVVDFGPFHVGYLVYTEGMSGISAPVSLVGTSLPMGVKLSNIENGFDLQPWTQLEDFKLKEAASKFFPNWNVISHFVSDRTFMNKIRQINSLSRIGSNILRSPRQCKERLNTLFESQPSLREEILLTERLHENISTNNSFELKKHLAELNLNTDPKGTISLPESEKIKDGVFVAITKNNTLLLPSEYYKKQYEKIKRDALELEQQQNVRINVNKKRKKRFINISSTAMKRDRSSLPIPGYTGDSNVPLAIVQSHHSHAQAVTDVVRQSNGGTAEMWPLPLLDLADKQRLALIKSKLQDKPTSYTHSTAQQAGSQSTISQHRSGLNTNNSVASIPQNVVKHQPRQQQNTHSYQPIQKMQTNQQQTLVQHTHSHANVAYSKQQSPGKNHSIQNQHELVKQAARAAALAPSSNNRIVHSKMNIQGNLSTGQSVAQRQIQIGPSRDFAATNDPLSIHASMSSNNAPSPPLPLQHQRHHPQHSSVTAHGNVPPIGMSPIRGNTPPRTSNRSNCK